MNQKAQKVLVTGGTGFIGSHACVVLQQAGYEVVVLDNLCNSSAAVIGRIEAITGHAPQLVVADVRDRPALDAVLGAGSYTAVMHFAGLKAVGESVEQPGRYHDNNVNGSKVLLDAMQRAGVKTLVFSSTATVYGDPQSSPVTEDAPLSATQPYAQTKLDIEQLLRDRFAQDPAWRIACLRYFNPVGAHPSGLIGEDPRGIPNNLMPYISQVAVGRRACVQVFGDDYETGDGTGVRDYVHVMDLVEGHLAALDWLVQNDGLLTLNLGTGSGVSVLQMIRAFELASGRAVPYEIVARRAGDLAEYWADPSRAQAVLGWRAQRSLEQMCHDSWNWQSRNPEGYGA